MLENTLFFNYQENQKRPISYTQYGPHGEALDWLEVGGSKGEIQARAFIMVSSGRSRWAGQASLGLATLKNFRALWGTGGLYLPGTSPRGIRTGGQEFRREGGGACGL